MAISRKSKVTAYGQERPKEVVGFPTYAAKSFNGLGILAVVHHHESVNELPVQVGSGKNEWGEESHKTSLYRLKSKIGQKVGRQMALT